MAEIWATKIVPGELRTMLYKVRISMREESSVVLERISKRRRHCIIEHLHGRRMLLINAVQFASGDWEAFAANTIVVDELCVDRSGARLSNPLDLCSSRIIVHELLDLRLDLINVGAEEISFLSFQEILLDIHRLARYNWLLFNLVDRQFVLLFRLFLIQLLNADALEVDRLIFGRCHHRRLASHFERLHLHKWNLLVHIALDVGVLVHSELAKRLHACHWHSHCDLGPNLRLLGNFQ